MRRTVLLTECDWNGSLPRVNAAIAGRVAPNCCGSAASTFSRSGLGTRVLTGRDDGLSGRCRAQQGCSSPQGIPAGAGVAKIGCARSGYGRTPGQQEWSCALEAEDGLAFCAVLESDRNDACASGALQPDSEASSAAAISFLDIPASWLIDWHGRNWSSVIAVTGECEPLLILEDILQRAAQVAETEFISTGDELGRFYPLASQ